jgi:hypothetical protein
MAHLFLVTAECLLLRDLDLVGEDDGGVDLY